MILYCDSHFDEQTAFRFTNIITPKAILASHCKELETYGLLSQMSYANGVSEHHHSIAFRYT